MSEVRHLPRLLCLFVLSLLLMTCAARPNQGFSRTNPCAGGKGVASHGGPVVCIDDSATTLSVNPDPVTVWDADASGNPVTVQWFTKSGTGDPQITWKSDACMEPTACASGKCNGKTKKGATGKRCKYNIDLAGHPSLDPDVVLTPCCT